MLAARRKERIQALRACLPLERVFIRYLPKARYSPYTAAREAGISDSTAWKMMNRPRVKRAMGLFLEDAADQIGVSHESLLADLVEIRERCMQHRPVLDKRGKPVMVELADGQLAAAYTFDAHGAVAAISKIMELRKLVPARRVELTGVDGGPIETVATHINADMDDEEAARVYQDIIRGTLQ